MELCGVVWSSAGLLWPCWLFRVWAVLWSLFGPVFHLWCPMPFWFLSNQRYDDITVLCYYGIMVLWHSLTVSLKYLNRYKHFTMVGTGAGWHSRLHSLLVPPALRGVQIWPLCDNGNVRPTGLDAKGSCPSLRTSRSQPMDRAGPSRNNCPAAFYCRVSWAVQA